MRMWGESGWVEPGWEAGHAGGGGERWKQEELNAWEQDRKANRRATELLVEQNSILARQVALKRREVDLKEKQIAFDEEEEERKQALRQRKIDYPDPSVSQSINPSIQPSINEKNENQGFRAPRVRGRSPGCPEPRVP
jgi:hypothetical protein